MHRLVGVVLLAALLGGCEAATSGSPGQAPYALTVPEGFPAPKVPAHNPMSEAKIELGRFLFYEPRLSKNEDVSCGTCHVQSRAFTDGRARSPGTTGEETTRNAMSLTNVAYNPRQTWANPLLAELEHQVPMPLFGEAPVEMGMAGREKVLLGRLADDPRYPPLFAAAFPEEPDPVNLDNIAKAVATFERTLISGDAPYDRFVNGDPTALSESAQRGFALFMSERLECFHCHGGFNFSDSVDHEGSISAELAFHNTGLYNVDGGYPKGEQGLFEITDEPADRGRFRAPTLRNVAVTAPYMHDGSIATLDAVIDHYAHGGRTLSEGPHAGVGADNPLKSKFVSGFVLSAAERADLLAFLESLTDSTFLTDPRFSDPFAPAE